MQDLSSWLQRKMPDIIAESPDSRAWFELSPSAPFDISDKYVNIAGVIPPVWNLEPHLEFDGDIAIRNGREADLGGDAADLQNGNGALSGHRMDVDQDVGRGGGMLEDSVAAMMRAGNDGQSHVQESDAQMDGGHVDTGKKSDARMDSNETEGGSADIGDGDGGAQGNPGVLSYHGCSDSRDESSKDEMTSGSGIKSRPKLASKPKPTKASGRNTGSKEKLRMENASKGHRESSSDAKAGLSKQPEFDLDTFVGDISHALPPPHPFPPRT
jgi:hypothetical protein